MANDQSASIKSAPKQHLRVVLKMAQLDAILDKYVKPGAEVQGVQGAAFVVKDKHGM